MQNMYDWRKMTPAERAEALSLRKLHHFPWHGPPHPESLRGWFHLSAACFEHQLFIGQSAGRMAGFSRELLETVSSCQTSVCAWCVLPNHYHLLTETPDLAGLMKAIGQFHGRTSRQWNLEENSLGRKTWYRTADRAIRSRRHFWATINYIHYNPVKHGLVSEWLDWP
jgi:putative transposase